MTVRVNTVHMAANPYMHFCATYRSSSEWVSKGYDRLPVPDQGKLLGQLYRSSCDCGGRKASSVSPLRQRRVEGYYAGTKKGEKAAPRKRIITFQYFKDLVMSLPERMVGKLPSRTVTLLVVALAAMYFKSERLFALIRKLVRAENEDSPVYKTTMKKITQTIENGSKLHASDAVPEKVKEEIEKKGLDLSALTPLLFLAMGGVGFKHLDRSQRREVVRSMLPWGRRSNSVNPYYLNSSKA